MNEWLKLSETRINYYAQWSFLSEMIFLNHLVISCFCPLPKTHTNRLHTLHTITNLKVYRCYKVIKSYKHSQNFCAITKLLTAWTCRKILQKKIKLWKFSPSDFFTAYFKFGHVILKGQTMKYLTKYEGLLVNLIKFQTIQFKCLCISHELITKRILLH